MRVALSPNLPNLELDLCPLRNLELGFRHEDLQKCDFGLIWEPILTALGRHLCTKSHRRVNKREVWRSTLGGLWSARFTIVAGRVLKDSQDDSS